MGDYHLGRAIKSELLFTFLRKHKRGTIKCCQKFCFKNHFKLIKSCPLSIHAETKNKEFWSHRVPTSTNNIPVRFSSNILKILTLKLGFCMQNSNFMVKYHLLLNRENNKNQLYQNKSNILIQKNPFCRRSFIKFKSWLKYLIKDTLKYKKNNLTWYFWVWFLMQFVSGCWLWMLCLMR